MAFGLAASSASLVVLTASLSSQQALGPNDARQGLVIYNGSSAVVDVFYAASGSSTSSLTYKIAPSGTNPDMSSPIRYTGPIQVSWEASAAGSLFVTEYLMWNVPAGW